MTGAPAPAQPAPYPPHPAGVAVNLVSFLAGPAGRVLRAAAGIVMIAAGAAAGGAWWVLAAAGLLPLAAGILDLCLIGPLMRLPARGTPLRARLTR